MDNSRQANANQHLRRLSFSPIVIAIFSLSLPVVATEQATESNSELTTQQEPDGTNKARAQEYERIYVTASTHGSYSDAATKSATKMILSLRETPQSVSVITRQFLEDWNTVNIKDILQHSTGIHTSTLGGYDRPSFMIRGGEANLIQIDGVQQFPGGRRPDVNGDSVAFERVEIVRGANGLMTGVGEPTATINLVRKRAISHQTDAHIGVSAGRWGYQRIEADVSSPLTEEGNVRGRIAAAHYDRDSFIDRYGQKKTSVYATLEADVGDATLVRGGIEYADTASRGVINSHAAPYYFADGSLVNPRRNMTGMSSTWSSWPIKEKTYFVGVDHAFDNGWQLNAIATYNTIDMQGGELFFVYPEDFLNPDGSSHLGLGYSAVISSSEDKQKTFDLTLQGTYELLGREHDLILGYSYFNRDRTSLGNQADQTTISLEHLNYFTWTGDVLRYPFKDTGRSSLNENSSGGAFIATRVHFTDALKLITGARLTNWETRTHMYNPASGEFRMTRSEYEVDKELTPYAGLVYEVNDYASLYASYTDAFRPQNYYDAQDEILAPVTGRSYEGGIKTEFDLLNLSAAYFESEQDNVAERDEAFPLGYITPGGNTPYRSSGKGDKTKGYELEVSGEVYQGWNIYGGFSYAKTRDSLGEVIRTEIPQKLFNLSTTYQMPGTWQDLVLGAGMHWQSSYYVDSKKPAGLGRNENGYVITSPERREQGAVALVNLMARYSVNDHFSLSLNVNNLFDKEYFNSIASWDGAVVWGEPRNWTLSARYDW
ncbi:TonB-dependent siderophore receptor [Bowmanella sp. Y26]|uniref:TonB-dependent siderophore receptor n=1 Tax=Bowmanella yangjiangensis TaxID=2811230 RepID=UPI001BDD418D|nr:TonB-dependent siderophore receptor [Bowmanella yangjiangensis]MBT1065469.1 TonB-dependent siderophore receptor [Bowmanella yangjiangensis]